MAEFYFDNLAKNLPDVYQKHAEFKCVCGNVWRSTNRQCPKCGATSSEIIRENTSNNFKILEIERTANNDLRSFLDEIASILDINNATGATLDMYGKKYGQARGKATDAQYRTMILSKNGRSWCNGSYKDVVDALAQTFNCSVDDILISEVGVMAVTLEKIPFSTRQAELMVKNLLPVGVSLKSVLFEGTFEFAETEGEYDKSAGFSEAENGEIGGYLGWTGSQESIDELPI